VEDGVNAVVRLHLTPRLDIGKIGASLGPRAAVPGTFEILVKGEGGHAARLQQTVDARARGVQAMTNFQRVVSHNIGPLESVVIWATRFVGDLRAMPSRAL
jgi:amidohydrolase